MSVALLAGCTLDLPSSGADLDDFDEPGVATTAPPLTACGISGQRAPSGSFTLSNPTAGLGSSSAGSIFVDVLGKLGEGAFSFGEDQGLGWVLSLVTGQHGKKDGLDDQQIQAAIKEATGQVAQLEGQITDLKTKMDGVSKLIVTEAKQTSYDGFLGHMNDLDGELAGYQQAYNKMTDPNRPPGPLNGDEIAALKTMRDGLPTLMNKYYTNLASRSGTDSMLTLWNQLAWESLNYPGQPEAATMMTSQYLDRVYDQIDYYSAKVVQALNLYADAAHISFVDGGETYPEEDSYVAAQATCANAIIDQWSLTAAQGVGRIPSGTVVDLIDADTPLLWTNWDVYPGSVAGGDDVCGPKSTFCFADRFDANGAVTDTKLIDPVGVSGGTWDSSWNVPTFAQYKQLLSGYYAGAGNQSAGQSLSDWAQARGLTQFNIEKVVPHYGGAITPAAPLSIIPPLLTKVTDSTYGVLTSSDGTGAELGTKTPPAGLEIAGHVVGVRSFTKAVDATRLQRVPGASRPPASGGQTTNIKLQSRGGAAAFTAAKTCSPGTAYRVPDSAVAIQVTAVGGRGANGTGKFAPAGQAGVVTQILPMVGGSTVYVQVGGDASGITGGIGGGGDGGGPSKFDMGGGIDGASGGGGGASGISADPGCTHWLTVAGGGGGGGGGWTLRNGDEPIAGGRGGDAGRQGQGTDSAAGENNNQTQKGAGQAGNGQPVPPAYTGPVNTGASGGGDCSTSGGTGSTMNGGGGGAGCDARFATHTSGGGGGGGGGYWGGGSGGGGGDNAGGGGGAGGASFAIDTSQFDRPTLYTSTFDLAGDQKPSVMITPLYLQ